MAAPQETCLLLSPLHVLDKFLLHLAETHGGSSGSPVLGIVDNAWVVVGLHCAEVTNPKNGNKANKAILIKSIQDAINYPDEEDSASTYRYKCIRVNTTNLMHAFST